MGKISGASRKIFRNHVNECEGVKLIQLMLLLEVLELSAGSEAERVVKVKGQIRQDQIHSGGYFKEWTALAYLSMFRVQDFKRK